MKRLLDSVPFSRSILAKQFVFVLLSEWVALDTDAIMREYWWDSAATFDRSWTAPSEETRLFSFMSYPTFLSGDITVVSFERAMDAVQAVRVSETLLRSHALGMCAGILLL